MEAKKIENLTVSNYVYSGAIHGVIAWTVYAIVECWFSSILPWIVTPGYKYKPLHWGFTVLLFALYPVIGLILGGLSGICIRKVSGRITFLQNAHSTIIFSAAAISTVVLAFAVNLVINLSFKLSVLAIVLICILLIICMFLSAGSGIWSSRFRFIANSWTCCIIILGLSWILMQSLVSNDSKVIKAGVLFIYVFAVLLISFIVQMTIRTRATHSSTTRSFVFLVPAILIVLGFSFFLKQAPLRGTSHLNPSPLKSDNPNVIIITMDTVRADHLSLYGYKRDTTPKLKKFAESAVLYTNAITSGASTLPTHASIFTGMYSRSHGAHHRNNGSEDLKLNEKFHTLAENLSEKGYLTFGVVANWGFLGEDFGLDQGFQYYYFLEPVPFLGEIRPYLIRQWIRNIFAKYASTSTLERKFSRAEDINKKVFSVLTEEINSDERFFLFINYMDAHWPYIPPSPFDKLYPGKDKDFNTNRYTTLRGQIHNYKRFKRKVTDEEHNHLVSQYDGGIAYIDFHIGKLLALLKTIGQYENTMIIITSDHGEAFGERNFMEHNCSVYQDQVYVPLIIKYPNTNKSIVVNELAHSVDIMPTVLGVLGYEIPVNLQGQNLLRDKRKKQSFVISERYTRKVDRKRPRFNSTKRAIFSEQYKFISPTTGKRELYDLSKDPNEKKNLYDVNGSKSMELEAKLNQWLKITKEEPGTATKLDKDALESLKALGYMQ